MKKISILLVLLFVGLMIMNVQLELDSKVVFSDLALENIEALAESELNHCEICYGFEMNSNGNCKICELVGGDVVCDIHDQIPC